MPFEDDIKKQIGLPESSRLKYEPLLPSSSEIGRIICAFSNTDGGILLLGVLSKNNKISVTGLSADFQVNVVLYNAISKLSPPPLFEQGVILHQGKQLFAIKVLKSNQVISYNKRQYGIKSKRIYELNPVKEIDQNTCKLPIANEVHLDEILKYLIDNPGLINVNKHTVREIILNNQVSVSEAEQLITELRNSDYVKSYGARYIGISIDTKQFINNGGFSNLVIKRSPHSIRKNIFISYNWNHKVTANRLYEFLDTNGYSPSMDDHNLGYKDRISTFMESIRASDFAILIISDEYLKSENCMTEVLHVLNDRDSSKKILPIRHKDVKIFKPADRIRYVEFWRSQIEEREGMLTGIDPTSAIEEFKKLKIAKRIHQDIGDFLSDISDMITNTIEEQEKNSYLNIITYIQRR
ncbi:TIR domain-containing protein [Dyadobacter sp. CY356]|uniref:TIR domain-containing protein n=1 Tax=Dyadobacter sp. CY356 TaxID=2906442 RepID=UPI001F370C7E|nr:TIR domain-containing protein [Dyadobacter sp. CY356]MCF0055344.1 TIR domain-containing protein [Dyadobacter sp. CY356]